MGKKKAITYAALGAVVLGVLAPDAMAATSSNLDSALNTSKNEMLALAEGNAGVILSTVAILAGGVISWFKANPVPALGGLGLAAIFGLAPGAVDSMLGSGALF